MGTKAKAEEHFQEYIGEFLDQAPPPPDVPRKDALYWQARLRGMSMVEAYKSAGFPVAAMVTHQAAAAERRVMSSDWVHEICDRHGLNLDVFVLKMAEGLDATTSKEYYNSKTGELIQGKPRIDYATRMRYLELLGKALFITKANPELKLGKITNKINILAIGEKFQSLSAEELMHKLQKHKLGIDTQGVQLAIEAPDEDEDFF